MPELAAIDLVIVVLYVAGTTLFGAWFARRQKSVKTYLVGDRDVGWPLILASIVATETSTVTFLSVPGLAYARGGNLTFLQLALGYLLGRVIVAWFLLPQYFRGETYSAYQILRERFSPAVQRTASAIFLLTRTIADGLRLFLTALLLQQFTGWDMAPSILVMGLATIIYTYLGGMQAVIWTDLVQLLIYLLGAIAAGIILLGLLPGGVETFWSVGQAQGKFRLFDFDPDPAQNYTFWAGVVGGGFFSMASHGADQIMVQRYLSSRSLGHARAALVLSGFCVILQFLLFLLLGVGLFVAVQQGVFAIASDAPNDAVFGAFIVQKLPTGLVGLVVAAVLASAMSTLSSSLSASASAVVGDFYRPARPNLPEQSYLRVSRGLTLLWGLAQMGVALGAVALASQRSIVDRVLAVAGFTTGLLLGLFILGSQARPVSSRSALIGLLAGLAAVTGVWLPSTQGATLLAWPWYAPVGTITTVGVALLTDRIFGHGSTAN